MRILFLSLFSMLTIGVSAQSIDSAAIQTKCKRDFELGINTTLLLKQVFDLSNNTFPMLPYDITFKMITGRSALRVGIGGTVDNTTTSHQQYYPGTVPGLDPAVPIYSNSYMLFARAGWEMRFPVEKRFLCSIGFDLAAQKGKAAAQTYYENNNLPTYYYYSRSNTSTITTMLGGGPELGVQFNISEHLSLSTEAPFYVFYHYIVNSSNDFSDQYNNGSSYSYTATDKTTDHGIKASFTVPVTLYFNIKF